MAYFRPQIKETGLSIPTYNDLRDAMMEDYYRIFGNSSYIEIDAADYEFMSILSKYIYDGFLLGQLNYTNRAPSTVMGGESQDSLYTINGIRRKSASRSTCIVKCSGTPNTIINNGVVRDVNGNLWDLIDQVQIGVDGTVHVTATAQKEGRIIALPNDIRFINSPTFGWASVTNEEQALTGSAIESNQEFRERRMQSVSNPSRTVMEGIIGAVAAVEGVTRFRGYENDTGSPLVVDGLGNTLPPHSICMVVEGGDKTEIARQIYLHKTPGCDTVGDQITTIHDMYLNPNVRRFYYAGYQSVHTKIQIQKLAYFNDDDTVNIKKKVKEYIDGLKIGQNVIPSMITVAALGANISLSTPTFSVISTTAGLDPSALSTANVEIDFNKIAIISIDDIEVIGS